MGDIMNKLTITSMLIGASLILSTAAFSQSSGSEGRFSIHNKTDKNTVVGFYTNDGSGWSTNWLSEQLTPGQEATAQFDATTGGCDQILKVGWLGENGSEVLDEPISINICEASNVYVADNEIFFD